MEQYKKFVAEMLPIVRKGLEGRYKNTYELNAAAMEEVYRIWETEEKQYLPRIYGVKLSELQQMNAGVLNEPDQVDAMVKFLDKVRAPGIIQVDSDNGSLYLTVENTSDGEVLRDWVAYKLKGRPFVMWHYLKEDL